MEKYFNNSELLQNTLLLYFCDEKLLKLINKLFYKLNYEKYLIHTQPHGIVETYYENSKIKERKTYKNGKIVMKGMF
jgi:antitoxin component YwqK of YwqJK toxin-antitoxin module